jgi:hypothetical protein
VTLRLALFLLVLGPACSVTALAERERSIAINECASPSDCINGECVEGVCVVRNGDLKHLAFELTPSARAGAIGGKSMWIRASEVNGPVRDLAFDGVSRVTGHIRVALAPGCVDVPFVGYSHGRQVKAAKDGTIPARVTFTQTAVYGLAAENFTASVDTLAKENELTPTVPPKNLNFSFNVPAGFYDIYIEPAPIHSQATEDERKQCQLAPQLLLKQAIASYSDFILNLEVPAPASLELEVRFPADASLAGWALDMIDPESGRVLSTRITIPEGAKSGWPSTPPLRYLPVAISGYDPPDPPPERSADELVRLAPPAGIVAPTFLFERSALELFEKGSGVLAPLESMPTPVDFEGRVLRRGSSTPVPSSVTLTATRLLKVPTGVFASFSRTVATDGEGRFELPLLPGSYRVEAVPSRIDGQSGGALVEADWEVPASPETQAGRVMEVEPVLEVEGRARLRLVDTFAFGASAGVEPSVLRPRPNALARLLGASTVPPRSARSSIGDTAGIFALSTDPGTFDFFVRPPQESNFAWYVMPGLELTASKDLGTVELPLPVRLEGNVSIRSFVGPEPPTLTQSLLRAYVLLDEAGAPTSDDMSDDTKVRLAVPVAETRVDELGHYILNVPASLNPAGNRGN